MNPPKTPAGKLLLSLLPPIREPFRWSLREWPIPGGYSGLRVFLLHGRNNRRMGWANLNPDGRKFSSATYPKHDGDDTFGAIRIQYDAAHANDPHVCRHPTYTHTVEAMAADLTEQVWRVGALLGAL